MNFKYLFTALVAPLITLPSMVSANELGCLAQVIHHEARGEPYLGKLAVGHVVINRTKSRAYKGTICSVVTAADQFTNFKLGKHRPSKESIKAAHDTFRTKDPTGGALYFRVGTRGRVKIGNHVFK